MPQKKPHKDVYNQNELQETEQKTNEACARCGKSYPVQATNSHGPRYATMDIESGPVKVCYKCCALYNKEWMRKHGCITLYLKQYKEYCDNTRIKATKYKITNWPGSLTFTAISWDLSNHNWGLIRIDVWFEFDKYIWHGVHVGHNTELVHCKRTKQKM